MTSSNHVPRRCRRESPDIIIHKIPHKEPCNLGIFLNCRKSRTGSKSWNQCSNGPTGEGSSSWWEAEERSHSADSPVTWQEHVWEMIHAWCTPNSHTLNPVCQHWCKDRTAHGSHPNLERLFNQQNQNQTAKPRNTCSDAQWANGFSLPLLKRSWEYALISFKTVLLHIPCWSKW